MADTSVLKKKSFDFLCGSCGIKYGGGVGGGKIISLEKTHIFIKINTITPSGEPSTPLVIVLRADLTDIDLLLVCNEDIRKLDALNIKLSYVPESNIKRKNIKEIKEKLQNNEDKLTQYDFAIKLDRTLLEVEVKSLEEQKTILESENTLLENIKQRLKIQNIVATRK